MSVDGEVCFDLQKPMIGPSPGRVCLSGFGEVRVEHRLLKAPVTFSRDRVRAVFVPGQPVVEPTLAREPVILHLAPDGMTPANAGFVFSAPVRVGPFTFAARRVLPLGRSQLRQGVEVDLLALTLADPDLFVASTKAMGLGSSHDLGRTLGEVIAPVPPELAAEVRDARRRRQRRSALRIVGVGLALAALMGAAGAGGSLWAATGRFAAAAAAVALLAGLLLSVPRTEPRVASALRRWGLRLFSIVAVLVGVGAALGISRNLFGAPYLLVWSLLAGAIGGAVVAMGLRAVERTSPPARSGHPLVEAPRSVRPMVVPAALVCVAIIAGAAVLEDSSAQLVRDVQRALITEDELSGWTVCCDSDGILRGSELDQHICGNDDAALPAHLAGVRRSFNQLVPGHDDLADVHFDLTLLVAASSAEAEREFAVVDDPDYLTCTAVSIGKQARSFQPEATDLADAELESRSRATGVNDTVIDQFRVRVPVSGTFDVMTGYFVRAQVGRTIVRMPVLEYVSGSLEEGELDALVRQVVAKVEAADL